MVSGDDQAESKSGSHAHANRDVVRKGTTGRGRLCSPGSATASAAPSNGGSGGVS